MKLTASAVLSGLFLAGSLSLAQAQTTTTTTPVAPDSKATNATPRAADPTGVNSPQGDANKAMPDKAMPSKDMAEQTMGTDHMMTKREADAAYADAKRQCKSLSGQERSICLHRAHDDHKSAMDMNRDGRKDGTRNPSSQQDLPQSGTR